ncbi:MAG: PspC domain-containing protein [Candidatus Zixiibacteriota bacterium]
MSEKPPRKLYRSSSDRMLAGVCGGLAKFLNVDSTVVRIVFAVGAFFGGLAIVTYVVCWLVIPEESA